MSNGKGWTSELALMFTLGFVAASVFWVGVWVFHQRPTQASAMEQQESTVVSCQAENARLQEQARLVATEKTDLSGKLEESNRQLREAQLGWGRCIRSQNPTVSD
ncbi:MAG: hypothetical protein ACE5HB_10855 [Terriglobia bacterium]